MPPTSAKRSAGTLRTTSIDLGEGCWADAVAARFLFWFDFAKRTRKTQATQVIGANPRSRIQRAVSAGEVLLALRTGSQPSRNSKPTANRLATASRSTF